MTVPPAEPLAIALRAYVPATAKKRRKGNGKPRREPEHSDWALVFDVETTIDAAQERRIVTYQVRHDGELVERGIAYEPSALDKNEIALLKRYACSQGFELMTVAEFVRERFFPVTYALAGRCIGFNLPFDLSRLAIDHKPGRTRFRNGFIFVLTDDPKLPRVRVKHLNRHAAMIEFTVPASRSPEQRNREKGGSSDHHRGFFCDAKTLGDALTSGSHTLASLAKLLQTPTQKLETEEHGGPLTDKYLDYAVTDPQVTWECFERLEESFDRHGLSETRLHQLKSEATLGKAYLAEMGVQPWKLCQPGFSPELLGAVMSSYFGGRAAVKRRHEVTRVLYCDFRAMYASVCTLLGLWQFVTADGVVTRGVTNEVRELLAGLSLDDLRQPSFWRKLCVLVQVEPDADLFPVRADYAGTGQPSIGLNYLSKGRYWFTLAEVIASALLTGKVPRVVRAVRFEPRSPQEGLKPIDILGNPDYRIGPYRNDFYRHLVDLRGEVKRECAAAEKAGDLAQKDRLDAEQKVLKVIASATSYGIFVELNVHALERRGERTGFGHAGRFTTSPARIEEPGKFFHPLLGTLITGGARLMLALAETLAAREGIGWAFCDTDSMAFARPEGMEDDEFIRRATEVCDWFTPLSPYADGGRLLETEKENFALRDGKETDTLEPLYFLGISAKRYVLFNIGSDGKPILRKASAHGLGHLEQLYGEEEAPKSIPAPVVKLSDVGVARWQYDLWYRIAEAALAGKLRELRFDDLPGFNRPAMASYTAATGHMAGWFCAYNEGKPYREQVRPFGFFISPVIASDGYPVGVDPNSFNLVAPFNSDQRQWGKLRYLNLHDPSGPRYPISTSVRGAEVVRVKSYAEVALDYLFHPEAKSLGPDGEPCGPETVGELFPRHVEASRVEPIGKEANRLEEIGLLSAEEAVISYGSTVSECLPTLITSTLRDIDRASLVRLSGLSRRALADILAGRAYPRPGNLKRLKAIAARHARQQLRAWGIRAVGDELDVLEQYQAEKAKRGSERLCEGGCGRQLSGPRRRFCDACKQRTYRQRNGW
jgi:hypothetical protein